MTMRKIDVRAAAECCKRGQTIELKSHALVGVGGVGGVVFGESMNG